MKGDENRRETRRDEKVQFKYFVTRLGKPLVAWATGWVVHSSGPLPPSVQALMSEQHRIFQPARLR
jgi:hypothetical protein